MISHLSSSSGVLNGNPTDNTSTNCMIARTSGNRSNHHDYLENNANFSHGDPMNSASIAGKPKTVYAGNNRYPISIIQLDEFLVIA